MLFQKKLTVPSLIGGNSKLRSIGFIGDSITETSYLTSTPSRYRWTAQVSTLLAANESNEGVGGATLASFLPYIETTDHINIVVNFPGQIVHNTITDMWYWDNEGSWKEIIRYSADFTVTIGTATQHLDNIINLTSLYFCIFSHIGTNDDMYRVYGSGQTRDNFLGDKHYYLLMKEIIKRIEESGKTVKIVTGISQMTDFQGTDENFYPERIAKYSNVARHVAVEMNIDILDMGPRFAVEYALGRKDWLSRNSQKKPDNQTQEEWNNYLASVGDPEGIDSYRVSDWTEDFLHKNDFDKQVFYGNQHPNVIGNYIIANEIIKWLGEIH